MSNRIVTATISTSLPQIWRLIFHKHVHGVPIVDVNRKLIGIISEADLLTKLFPDYREVLPDFIAGEEMDADIKDKLNELKNMSVEKVMNRKVYFTRPETNVMRALSRMLVRKVRQLPVLDDNDRIIGMLSKGDIFDKIFKKGISKIKSFKKKVA